MPVRGWRRSSDDLGCSAAASARELRGFPLLGFRSERDGLLRVAPYPPRVPGEGKPEGGEDPEGERESEVGRLVADADEGEHNDDCNAYAEMREGLLDAERHGGTVGGRVDGGQGSESCRNWD